MIIAGDAARLAADDAVEDRTDAVLRGLADLVARLAQAEYLLAGSGILGFGFTNAGERQKLQRRRLLSSCSPRVAFGSTVFIKPG